jgi:hypothetical protein
VISVPVRVEGLEGVGTYSGTLTAGGVDFDEQLLLSDTLWWAVVCVAIGFGISVLLLLITKRWWPVTSLKDRANSLEAKYTDARKAFKKQLGGTKRALIKAGSSQGEAETVKKKLKGYKINTGDIQDYRENFVSHLEDYIGDSFFVDTSSQEYKDVSRC